jgi:2,4-dienoyl-CoA reductase-like NADH-dependent reductase (Old Yellow Enzyme family)
LENSMTDSPHLFTPLAIRDVTLRNRIAVSPMCQYSSEDGFANDWHLVHLGSRAVGGAGLVMVEATAVEARGRITPGDHGLWKDEHVAMLSRIAAFVKGQGSVPGIQIAHAGRKASCRVPWEGGRVLPLSEGSWQCVAPSAVAFHEGDPLPAALSKAQIAGLTQAFAAAARRALAAGFEVLEIHSAHGYLLHEFLSPLSNQRADDYGGAFENRVRFLLEAAAAVRAVWPERLPLWVRISATDWADGGWSADDSVRLAGLLREKGVDLIDCSSGGLVPYAQIPSTPGYQAPFAERIKRETGILTGAVGLITEAEQADAIIRESKADIVLMARAFLRDPYWPLHAAQALGVNITAPVQYQRAFPKSK